MEVEIKKRDKKLTEEWYIRIDGVESIVRFINEEPSLLHYNIVNGVASYAIDLSEDLLNVFKEIIKLQEDGNKRT